MNTAVIKTLLKIAVISLIYVFAMTPFRVDAASISPSDVYSATNNYRTELGKNSLRPNNKLEDAAKNKAQDMFNFQYWSHYGPDGSTPWTFIHSAGYQYQSAGENLAKGVTTANQTVEAWRASPSHDANLRGDYTEIGVAAVAGTLNGVETVIVVAMYAEPISPAVKEVRNAEQKPTNTTLSTQQVKNTEITKSTKGIEASDQEVKEVGKEHDSEEQTEAQLEPKADSNISPVQQKDQTQTTAGRVFAKLTNTVGVISEFYILTRNRFALFNF